jgi:hypothetical protein
MCTIPDVRHCIPVIEMSTKPRFQFELLSLLFAVTVVAVLLAVGRENPEALRGLLGLALIGSAAFVVLVLAMEIVSWIREPGSEGEAFTKKLRVLLCSRPFWMASCIGLSVAILLNGIPYFLSRGAYQTDGWEVAGWPWCFWAFGGIGGYAEFDEWALFGDVLVGIVLSAAAGVGFRHGAGPLLDRARIVIHKARTWPDRD